MHSTRELIMKLSEEGDREKMILLGDMLEELIEESENREEHREHLHELLKGPHFDEHSLKECGAKMKYSVADISKFMTALGIKFDPCVTVEDVTYAANYLYFMFYPLISDINQAIKFAEKYIKDANYPIKNAKAFKEWQDRERLRKSQN